MDNVQNLNDLKNLILTNNICPKLASQATQLVMGSGNDNADIVFIGEAPGKKEDQTGLPFVGASGRFLDQMLEAAEMKREDVYITNIVKYRPPDNRDPTQAEKDAFLPYLIRQLEIINPKVVITLGRHSMSCFLPKAKIADEHGIATKLSYEDYEFMLIPLYHPAAALYNGSKRQVLIDDFVAAKKLMIRLACV